MFLQQLDSTRRILLAIIARKRLRIQRLSEKIERPSDSFGARATRNTKESWPTYLLTI